MATEALGNCQGGHGVLWRPVWCVAAAILDMGCSVGVSYSDHTPLQGPVMAAWWQQAGRVCGGDEGGVAGRETKRATLGGLGLTFLCGVAVMTFCSCDLEAGNSCSNRTDTN